MIDEVVGADVEAAGLGRFAITPMTVNCYEAEPDPLADRIVAREERLRRRLAEHDDVLAALHFARGEEPPGLDRELIDVRPALGGAEDDQRLRALVAVVDALLLPPPGRRRRA